MNKKKSDIMLAEAQQFVMKRIESLSLEDGRDYYVEPKLITEWAYYVKLAWEKNKLVRSWDKSYMDDKPLGLPKE